MDLHDGEEEEVIEQNVNQQNVYPDAPKTEYFDNQHPLVMDHKISLMTLIEMYRELLRKDLGKGWKLIYHTCV